MHGLNGQSMKGFSVAAGMVSVAGNILICWIYVSEYIKKKDPGRLCYQLIKTEHCRVPDALMTC
jgi:hypothetical protein